MVGRDWGTSCERRAMAMGRDWGMGYERWAFCGGRQQVASKKEASAFTSHLLQRCRTVGSVRLHNCLRTRGLSRLRAMSYGRFGICRRSCTVACCFRADAPIHPCTASAVVALHFGLQALPRQPSRNVCLQSAQAMSHLCAANFSRPVAVAAVRLDRAAGRFPAVCFVICAKNARRHREGQLPQERRRSGSVRRKSMRQESIHQESVRWSGIHTVGICAVGIYAIYAQASMHRETYANPRNANPCTAHPCCKLMHPQTHVPHPGAAGIHGTPRECVTKKPTGTGRVSGMAELRRGLCRQGRQ